MTVRRPSREEAEAAVRVLLRWACDDPEREGLRDTPKRVAEAYEEFFVGYSVDPVELLARSFEETDGYDEMVVLRDIRFESHCEHHMAPIIGRAHIAYLPDKRVVGISKLARVLEAFSKRLSTSWMLFATWAVSRSWICRRFAKASSTRASLEMPTTRLSGR